MKKKTTVWLRVDVLVWARSSKMTEVDLVNESFEHSPIIYLKYLFL